MSAPVKVKCFAWLFLRNKIAMRDRLLILDVIAANGSACPICDRDSETGQHIFLHCDRIYKLWLASLWGRNFVGASDMTTCFEV